MEEQRSLQVPFVGMSYLGGNYCSVRGMQFINIEAEIKRKADDWQF